MSRQTPNVRRGLEVIRFRGSADAVQIAEQNLLELLVVDDLPGARVYRNSEAPQDLSLHLSVEPNRSEPSELGLRITASLRELGQVSHSLWTEISTFQTTSKSGEWT